MEAENVLSDYLADELSAELAENTDYKATILDIKTMQGVLEVIHELPGHPNPMLCLRYILKVESDLQDAILQQLLPHPGIKYIEKIPVRYLVDFKLLSS
ncbi:hypothetical protein HYW46_03855 [Candidatus Daviesbacteria bacterium]|nr:hypothetical protein [Candidatus Daviesbacteria bacterium]